MIACNKINSEATRLKAVFEKYNTLSAADLDSVVDLILAVQTCGVGSNQDNVFRTINVTYDALSSSVAQAFNSLPAFTISETELLIVLVRETNVASGNIIGTKKTYGVKGFGKGTYGVGYSQLSDSNFFLMYEGSAGINFDLFNDTATTDSATIVSTNVAKLNPVTQTTYGVMSPADKSKLDNIITPVQGDWNQANIADPSYIQNKPINLSNFIDDINAINVKSDWNETNPLLSTFIENKPILAPSNAEQNVQSDWNEASGSADSFILNKPVIPSALSQLTDDIGLTPIQSDWAQANSGLIDFIKNKPAIPAGTNIGVNYTANNITVTSNTGTSSVVAKATGTMAGVMSSTDKIKLDSLNANAEQNVQVNWNELDSGSDSFILNKPTIINVPDSFKFVSDKTDFPPSSGGAITLLAGYTYYITDIIDLTGDRLVGEANTAILGSSSENSILTSTGLGIGIPLLSSVYSMPVRDVCIKDVDTALSFDGTTNPDPMALDWGGVNFMNVPNIGTIKKASNFIFDKGSFINSKGLKFDGTIGTVALNNSIFSGDGASGDIIKLLSTCVITRRFRVIYSSVVAFGSTVGINVDVSATVPVEAYILDTVNFSGGGTYLSGVTVTDNKTNFTKCKGIQNTNEISLYYMRGNATATVIAATSTSVKALGTTTSAVITQKFINTNNRATYSGSLTRNFKVSASLSLESGNNQKIGCYIAKNGIVINDSEVYITTSGVGKFESLHVQTLLELNENDYIEVWIENTTAITNITVTDLNLIIQ